MAIFQEREHFDLVARVSRVFLNDLPEWSRIYDEIDSGYKYIAGAQYTKKQINWYKSQRRPTKEFNVIFSTLNTVLGDMLSQLSPISVFSHTQNTKLAQNMQKVLKHIDSENEYRDVFSNIAVSGFVKCGWVYPRFSDEKEPDGSVVFTDVDEFEIMFDPSSKHLFLDDASYVIRSRFLTLEDLMFHFPQHAKTMKESLVSVKETGYWGESSQFMRDNLTSINFVDQIDGRYRLLEYHEMDWERTEIVEDMLNGSSEIFSLEGKRADLFLKLNPHVRLTKKIHKVKRVHTVLPALNMLLDTKKADIQDGQYDYICFHPYRYGKTTIDNFGVFRNAQSPQDVINEYRNLSLHSIAKAVNPGFTTKPDYLLNAKVVERDMNQPGVNPKIKKNAPPVSEVIRRNEPPSYAFSPEQIGKEALDILGRITGVTPNFSGVSETRQENASLFAHRVSQASKNMIPMNNNFKSMRLRLYNKVLKLVQHNYTDARYFFITNPDGRTEEVVLNTNPMNTITQSKFKITVSEANDNPTQRFSDFIKKTEVVRMIMGMFGGAIASPTAIIDTIRWWLKDSDLPDSDEFVNSFAQSIQQQIQVQQEQQEQQQAMSSASEMLDLAKKRIEL